MAEGDPPVELHGLLARAAQMRAGGETWPAVATALGRAVSTVEQWPSRHPQAWSKALVGAIENALGEYENEALLTARMMLRSKDERAKADAMRALLRYCADIRRMKQPLEIGGTGAPLAINLIRGNGEVKDGDGG